MKEVMSHKAVWLWSLLIAFVAALISKSLVGPIFWTSIIIFYFGRYLLIQDNKQHQNEIDEKLKAARQRRIDDEKKWMAEPIYGIVFAETLGHSARTLALRLGINAAAFDHNQVKLNVLKKMHEGSNEDSYKAEIMLHDNDRIECIVVLKKVGTSKIYANTYFPMQKKAYFNKYGSLDFSLKDSTKSVEDLVILHHQVIK